MQNNSALDTSALQDMMRSTPVDEMRRRLLGMSRVELDAFPYHWPLHARRSQLPPEGDSWLVWLILAGRGWGKTRVGTEWIRTLIEGPSPLMAAREAPSRIALVAETAADARDVLVEGESGVLEMSPPDQRPLYEPSKRRLTWPNGVRAFLYNATEPDQLRGPQHGAAWCDELAKWKYARDTWDQLQFGLRIGMHPRQVITTTPRPLKILKEIGADPATVVTRRTTYDNLENLSPAYTKIIRRYEGTRLGRQELNAETLDDVPGALWTHKLIDATRIAPENLPDMSRVVVAVDPAVTAHENSDETGIMVCGKGVDGHYYQMADRTCVLSPLGWANRALIAYDDFDADAIVAEVNNGGDLVESNIHNVRERVKVIKVRASRGKIPRAEPIATLYELRIVHHAGSFPELEDQMTTYTAEGNDFSPDRMDAMVWGMTELAPKARKKTPRIRRG